MDTSRHRLLATALAVVVIGALFAIGPAHAESGADLVEACAPVTDAPEVGPRTCKSTEAGLWLGAQTCRRAPDTEDDVCPVLDGRRVSEEAMADFEASWLAGALDLQRELDGDVPLVDALLPHTHNSANSASYDPSVTSSDANQVVTVTDQLRLGMRAIEFDVHWTPNPSGDPADAFRAPVQCHGEPAPTPVGAVHAGCSVDQPLRDLLVELRTWLDNSANDGEVVLLYLENALDGDESAHASAVADIEATIGDVVFRPSAGAGCQDLPVQTESKRSILATGARVLLTGNCGPGGWTDWVFQRGAAWSESGSTTSYACADDRGRTDYSSTLVRRYEDSTWLSAMAGGGSHISPAVLADMVRCGVNLPGLDQLYAGDPRLPSLVWSWRDQEPSAAADLGCAAQGTDARFFATDCGRHLPVACRTADGGWIVTSPPVPFAARKGACTSHDAAPAVPVNGWDNGLLRSAADAASAEAVWLDYARDEDSTWGRPVGPRRR